jgi:hypothetical protein
MTVRRKRGLIGVLVGLALGVGSCSDATGPRPPAQLEEMSGNAQVAQAGSILPAPLVIVLSDGRGNPLPEVPVRWGATAGGGTVTPAFGFTDAEGRAVARWTLVPKAGDQGARVTISGLATVAFTATARPAEPAKVELPFDSVRFASLGDTLRLHAKVVDRFDNRIPEPPLLFSSLDPLVADVDLRGLVLTRSNGTTRIIVNSGAHADTLRVRVEQSVAGLAVAVAADSLIVGDTTRLSVVLSDANGYPIEGKRISWLSSNPAVAEVDPAGLVLARTGGQVTLTAIVDDASAAVPLAVRLPKFRLNVERMSFERLGAEARVAGLLRGASVAPQRLRLIAEQRWLSETPVLDPEALARLQLRTAGAGRAWIEAAIDGAAPDTLLVQVTPRGATVHTMQLPDPGRAGPIRLRGYGMNMLDVSRIHVAGQPVVGAARDSATFEFTIPSIPNLACGTPAPLRIALEGAEVLTPLVIDRPEVEPVGLRAGETARLTPAQVACLRLPTSSYARYALAVADVRMLDRARPQPTEPAALSPIGVRVRDLSGGVSRRPTAQRLTAPAEPAAPISTHHLQTDSEAGAAPAWYQRSRPWRLGEPLAVEAPELAATRVFRIYGERFVLAAADTDRGNPPAYLLRLDSAMTSVLRHGLPLLQRTLSPAIPVSSEHAGQLVIAIHANAQQSATYTYLPGGRLPPAHLLVLAEGAVTDAPVSELVEKLVYHLAQAWQVRYLFESGSDGRPADLLTTDWAREGTAMLLSQETIRRRAGVPLLGNLDWAQALRNNPTPAMRAYAAVALRGSSLDGRHDERTAHYLRDLVMRRVMSGDETVDVALREVVRGALEGWHGRGSAQRAGLVYRMRERLGGRWSPESSLLIWVLSQPLDDRTASERLQNPAFLFAAREGTAAWQPLARIRTGELEAFEMAWPAGAAHYFLLEDQGVGGSLQLEAEADGTAWMLARIY